MATFELSADEPDRSWEVIDDSLVSVLRKDTRIGVARGTVSPVSTGDPTRAGFDVPLMCVVHAYPESDVRWAGSRSISRRQPGQPSRTCLRRTIAGTVPVEVQTTVGVGLSFSVLPKVLNAELKPEITRKKNVYFPELTSSGPDFHLAYWTFLHGNQPTVHVDRELRLLISAPTGVTLQPNVTIRAKIAPKGMARLLPLVARIGRSGRTYPLTS